MLGSLAELVSAQHVRSCPSLILQAAKAAEEKASFVEQLREKQQELKKAQVMQTGLRNAPSHMAGLLPGSAWPTAAAGAGTVAV